MKMYHGSRSLFNHFTLKGNGQHGEGFYFCKDYNEAKTYAFTLYGNGVDNQPTVYLVEIYPKKYFDTMSVEHCEIVMNYFNLHYKHPKSVGGLKEHYYYLEKQLKKEGISLTVNEAIEKSGFDCIYYAFMEHYVLFNSDLIEIIEINSLDF